MNDGPPFQAAHRNKGLPVTEPLEYLMKMLSIYDVFCFSDMFNEICAPVTDGWSTYEFPEDEEYFIRQVGKK